VNDAPRLSRTNVLIPVFALLLGAGCSSSSDGTSAEVGLGAMVQDLLEDDGGYTIVAPIVGTLPSVGVGNVEADGGQTAVNVRVEGEELVMVFDLRVTPTHAVRIVDVDGVSEEWRPVSTSDARRPAMTIVSATQDVSDGELGGDRVVVRFSGGPNVVESDVEDASNWRLRVNGLDLDLVGTTISLDVNSQTAQLNLGPLANLHATFAIAPVGVRTVADVELAGELVGGAATGDVDPPALEGAAPVVQVLDAVAGGDPLGTRVRVDFDEPISPVFGATVGNFGVIDHPNAITTTGILRAAVDPNDPSLVLLVFSQPVVPGLDRLRIDGVLDAHGNAFPAINVDVEPSSTVPNGFTSVDFVTVQGTLNDAIVAVLDQAIDPDTAARADRWTLEVDGAPVDLAAQELEYDLGSHTLTISLDFDATNGTPADLVAAGVVDVDGEVFNGAAPTAVAAGDAMAPEVESITQNRSVDPAGETVDVVFSEEVDVALATNAANYTFAPAIAIDQVTLIDGRTARIELAGPAVPGDVTLQVGAVIADPAGNTLGGVLGPAAIATTDLAAPAVDWVTAEAVEGLRDDVIRVGFDDMMIPGEVEDPARWAVESPVGSPVDVTGATISYDAVTRIARIVLDGGASPELRLDRELTARVVGARDLGGNAATAEPGATTVDGERNVPTMETAFLAMGAGDRVVLRFSEPMADLDDLYDAQANPAGVRYRVVHGTTMQPMVVLGAAVLDDGLGVELTVSFALANGSTVDVVGARDLAGNPLFPVEDAPIGAEVGGAPAFDGAPGVEAVTGARNDRIDVVFTAPVASWGLLDADQFEVEETGSGTPLDLSDATMAYDGDRTVSITLDGGAAASALRSGATYDVTLTGAAAEPLRTREGEELGAPAVEAMVAVTGDVSDGPTGASTAILSATDPTSVIVVFDEAIDTSLAGQAAEYSLGGVTPAVGATVLGFRTVRVTFPVQVAVASIVEVGVGAAVDAAGNAAAGTLSLAVVEDTTAPAIASVTALSVEGYGNDLVTITFDGPVDASTVLGTWRYSMTSAGAPVRVGPVQYDDQTNSVTAIVSDVLDGRAVTVSVESGVRDVAGNAAAAALDGTATATGDAVTPAISSAFVNVAEEATGARIDVLFSEPVDAASIGQISDWTTSDGTSVVEVEVITLDRVAIHLDGPLDPDATLTVGLGARDLAGNVAGDLSVDPVE